MPIPASRFPFDFDPHFLRWAQDAAREMEAIRAIGGFTAFERTQKQLRLAAEAMRLNQAHRRSALSSGPADRRRPPADDETDPRTRGATATHD